MIEIVLLTILCIFETAHLAVEIVMLTKMSREPKAPPVCAPQPITKPEIDPEELSKQREKFNAEMDAFQQLLNYNSDIAYGINHTETN